VFSLDNNLGEEIITVDLPNIIYASDKKTNEPKLNNSINVDLGKVKILGFNSNGEMSMQSNSCSTAYSSLLLFSQIRQL